MARTHGKGPKIVFVPAYRRWVDGKRETVRGYLRGMSPPPNHRYSPDQLHFGF